MCEQRIHRPPGFGSLEDGFPQRAAANGRRTLYVSNKSAWNANGKLAGGCDLGAQARQALRNLQQVVEAAGGTLANVVSLRIHVVDCEPHMATAVSDALEEFFPGDSAPASTWRGVASLSEAGFLIEIEAIAVLD